MIARDRLQMLLERFGGLTIGLVGDLFLDRYLDIEPGVFERSIETGLEAYQVTRVRNQPGALGTVMNNLAALGVGRLVPLTVLGDDGQAYDLLKELARLPVDTQHIVRDPQRLTPTYTKPLKQNEQGVWQELNRLDLRTRQPLRPETEAEVLERLAALFTATDGLIVLDQISETDQGVINRRVREALERLARQQPERLMFIDSRAHIGSFAFGTLKPNFWECLAAVGCEASDDPEAARRAAQQLCERTGRPLYCTLGERGMLVVRPGQSPVEVPGYAVEGPVDIVGAGDSATSGIVASLLAGADEIEAAAVGNLVASITVQQLGTTGTASPQQVLDRWDEVHCGRT